MVLVASAPLRLGSANWSPGARVLGLRASRLPQNYRRTGLGVVSWYLVVAHCHFVRFVAVLLRAGGIIPESLQSLNSVESGWSPQW